LFVVDRVDHETGKLHGALEGQRRTFTMSAMEPSLAANHHAGDR